MIKKSLSNRARLTMAVLIASTLTVQPLCPGPAGYCAGHANKLASAGSRASATGLDRKTLKLVNEGDWPAFEQRLQLLTSSAGAPSQLDAWLAFAYMFEGKCQECRKQEDRLSALCSTSSLDEVKSEAKAVLPVVRVLGLICQNKLEDAGSLATSLVHDNDKDVLANFTAAAVEAKRGHSELAAQYCQKGLAQAPDFAWGYRTLGFIQDRWLKQPENAESSYKQALAIDPHFQEARDLLVDLYLVNNNFDQAIETAKSAIAGQPKQAKNYWRLAEIYRQQWRLAEALVQLHKAMSLSPGQAKYHRLAATILRYQGQMGEALKEQQAAVDLSSDKAFELVELSALNVLAGNNNRAADNLRQALKLEPDNRDAHEKLVVLLYKEKRYDDLIAEYRRAIARKPKDFSLHMGLARALKDAGQTREAVAEFKQAANLKSNDPLPHREIAAILFSGKDYAGAIKEYTRALNINPSSLDDLLGLGNAYEQSQDYLQAEAAIVTAIALQQLGGSAAQGQVNHLDLLKMLASLFLKEGRYADAASQMEAVCAGSKESADDPYNQFLLAQAKALRDRTNARANDLLSAYGKLSSGQKSENKFAVVEALLEAGKDDMAGQMLSKLPADKQDVSALLLNCRVWQQKDKGKALELARQAAASGASAPLQCRAELALACVQLAAGNKDAAAKAARQAVALDDRSFKAYAMLGRVFLAQGDLKQSLAAAKRSLEINPYFFKAYILSGDAYAGSQKWKEAADSYKKAVDLYPGLLAAHKKLLAAYQKLSLSGLAKKEADEIAQIEKRN